MVFLAQKIRRKFEGSPTFVILTDREELNSQISDTFENCGLLGKNKSAQFIATSGEDLVQKLKGNPSFIFTLIQKFNKPNAEPIYPDHDIIIMSDEAHRSQYGIFADNMMKLLPTAARMGFTGTPLLSSDNITARTFGGYVSVYDFKRAVEDGATVPLYYENRGEKILDLHNPEITEQILDAIENADLDVDQQDKLEAEFAKEIHLMTAEPRLKSIARDFVNHYSDLWTSGKAMFVCLNKVTCVRMYNYVQEYWKEEIKQLKAKIKTANDTSCLAVLTQERLLRIFKKDPSLSFDCIIVDEAHEILEENSRSRTLANVIIIAQKRNPDVAFKFLTPFLTDSKNLKARYTTYDIEGFKVTEYIKTEKYYLYDLRNHTGLKLYDQFLNRYLPLSENRNLGFEEDVVKAYSAGKNIIYLNKPTDIEKFALALADVLPEMDSEMIQTACDNISNYLQPQYNLLACLRKGIIYHHGSVPDAIRIYIEDLYKKDDSVKYVITSSTLLSGVNLPAERMFILDNKRGRSNLSHDSFKNLVGRVCRFSEIFNDETGNLQRLEPQIYLVFGKYFAQNANCESFLRNVAKVEQNYKDAVDNVLLSEAKITTMNEEELRHASEFIENYENGVVEDYQERYTSTVSGKACIMNGITELDIFAHEAAIQQQVNGYQSENLKISDSNTLLETIYELFIQYLPDNGAESLKRLENQEARNFYSMMFEWRVENKSYAEMINLFVGYWQQLYKKDKNVIVYVGKWGDVKRSGSNVARYTKIFGKDRTQLINLAIVRIKEEQDFIDNTLIKYVEVLYDLELIEDNFYARIKYGTDDERAICLIKNGLSLSSAVLLIKKYNSYLQINVSSSTVVFDDALISEMKKENENQILIYEVQNCM